MIIFYNPDCSKCKDALQLLEQNNCSFELRDYLTIAPTVQEIKELLVKLGCEAFDIVRRSEPLFIEKYEGKDLDNASWISVLSEFPVLIERPIVIDGQRAIVGRPPTRILELLS